MEVVNEKYGSENVHNESAPESSLSEGAAVGRGDPLAPYAHLDEKKILRKVIERHILKYKWDYETDAVFPDGQAAYSHARHAIPAIVP